MFELTIKAMQNKWQEVKGKMQSFVSGEEAGLTDAVEIVKGLVMIVVIGAVGIFVADTVVNTTGTPTNAHLYNMSNNTLETGDTGSDFLVILVIAFIGGIAISYLAFFGVGRKR